MKDGPDRITDAELQVLKTLWDEGPATIRHLADRLYPGGQTAHYATVQKLLERLEAKGCVRRSRRERVNVFSATVDRRTLIARRLKRTADQLCAGSLTPLLTQLAGTARLSRRELAELRELIDRLARRPAGGA